MAEGRIVVAAGNRLPQDRRDPFTPDLFDCCARSEAALSLSGLTARVALGSAFVLVVLVAANLVMLRVLG
jgi:hypothetical protein